MRSHTDRLVNMVTGVSYFQPCIQTLNTKSSTEADIVRVGDVLTQVIWTQYFLKEKVYNIWENFIYQDNQSAIKLENNGRQ